MLSDAHIDFKMKKYAFALLSVLWGSVLLANTASPNQDLTKRKPKTNSGSKKPRKPGKSSTQS